MESRASIRQVIYMDACSVLINYSLVIRILDHIQILCSNQILFIGCRKDQFFVGINSHYLQMLQGGILSLPICNMVVYWDNLRYVRFLMMYLLYCDKFLLPSCYIMIIDVYISAGKQLYFLFDWISSDAFIWGMMAFKNLDFLLILHNPHHNFF